jgi:CheY-like chemotaxis protein
MMTRICGRCCASCCPPKGIVPWESPTEWKHCSSSADGPPSLMLVDLMMPRMNGEDLMRAMTQDPSLARIPIAIISGQLTARPLAQIPGVIARLVKPVELDELLTVVQQFAG